MILGIGIDSTEIARFAHWHTFSQKQLLRIFSESEIAYCLANPDKSARRFAARFATREALWKALDPLLPAHPIPFLTLCRIVVVHNSENNAPQLIVDWQYITSQSQQKLPSITTHLSLTHTRTIATAMVLLEKTL